MDMTTAIQALRDRGRRMVSLDTPKDADLGDVALDIGAGFLPGVGTALGARDVVRGYREGDPIGMALGAAGMIPVVGGASRAVSKALRAPRDEALEVARKNAVKMLGLPENNTAMDRARAMGFTPAYHGTNDVIEVMDRSFAGAKTGNPTTGLGISVATNPGEASRYTKDFGSHGTPNVMPLMIRKGEVYDMPYNELNSFAMGLFNAAGKTPKEKYLNAQKEAVARSDELKSAGYDTVRAFTGKPHEEIFVPDPSRIRSRFAAFDPARINENDLLGRADPRLLAVIAGGGLTGLTVNALRNKRNEEKEKNKEKETQ